jgi:hypothetical protein
MELDIISIIFLISGLILGIIIRVIDQKSNRKIWNTVATLLVISSAIPQGISILEKKNQTTEGLINKYSTQLNDTLILNKIRASVIKQQLVPFTISPTSSTYGHDAVLTMLGIYSPIGNLPMYKAIDPREYNFQGITPLVPVNHNDSVFYVGWVAIPKDKFSKYTKINLITKFDNGFIEVERIKIKEYNDGARIISSFFPLILTNIERLLLVQEAAILSSLPEITYCDETSGTMIFGNPENSENLPFAILKLSNNGGISISATRIHEQNINNFVQIFKRKLHQSPSISIKEVSNKQIIIF